MTKPKSIEELEIGRLKYRRYSFQSAVLQKETTYGIVEPFGPSEFVPERILYLFHAGNGDDRQPIQDGIIAAIDERAVQLLVQKKVRIVIPFIGVSFLHDHPGDRSRAISTQFFTEVMPMMESGKGIKDRYVFGLSMGGFAALSAFFRRPELFSGVAAQFPALIAFDYNKDAEVEAFAKRTKALPDAMNLLLSLVKPEFPELKDFHSIDPLVLAAAAPSERFSGKKIYFDVGSEDMFGCHEGTDLLHKTLTDRGISHGYEKVPGGKHDVEFAHKRFSNLFSHVLA